MFTVILCGLCSAAVAWGCGLGWLSLAVGAAGTLCGGVLALAIGTRVPALRLVTESLKLAPVHTIGNVADVLAVRTVKSLSDHTYCVYQMMVHVKDGSVAPYTLYANPETTKVYERNVEAPCLLVTVMKPDKTSPLLPFAICDEDRRYELYLPPASIRTQFFAR